MIHQNSFQDNLLLVMAREASHLEQRFSFATGEYVEVVRTKSGKLVSIRNTLWDGTILQNTYTSDRRGKKTIQQIIRPDAFSYELHRSEKDRVVMEKITYPYAQQDNINIHYNWLSKTYTVSNSECEESYDLLSERCRYETCNTGSVSPDVPDRWISKPQDMQIGVVHNVNGTSEEGAGDYFQIHEDSSYIFMDCFLNNYSHSVCLDKEAHTVSRLVDVKNGKWDTIRSPYYQI